MWGGGGKNHNIGGLGDTKILFLFGGGGENVFGSEPKKLRKGTLLPQKIPRTWESGTVFCEPLIMMMDGHVRLISLRHR